jgi:hypothetical protein
MERTKNSVLKETLQSSYWRAADAAAVLSAWRESGLSLRAYALGQGLSVSRLERWKLRLGAETRAVRFHRVEVRERGPAVPQAGDGRGVEIVLRGGRRLRVRCGFDDSLLESVARAVESWTC